MLTTPYMRGAPNWIDLGTPDVEAATAFYGALFGWERIPAGTNPHGYGFFRLDGKTVAAVGPLAEEEAGSAWMLYFHTGDAEATAAAVERAGGTVRIAPQDVGSAGRLAVFTDPAGARFAIWQPGNLKGLDVVSEVGALCWTELYTTDARRAKEFYRAVFDWTLRDMPLPDGSTCTLAAPAGGGDEAQHAGIMQLPPESTETGTPSGWHPYFEVPECDTAAAIAIQHGGTSLIPATDMPGLGRFAMFSDPLGAVFAVITGSGR